MLKVRIVRNLQHSHNHVVDINQKLNINIFKDIS